MPPTHPYRIVVTSAGSGRLRLSLVSVYKDAMPTRVRSPHVEKVLLDIRVPRPRNGRVAICNPPEPKGEPATVYERELQKLYKSYHQLAAIGSDE